MVGDGEKCADNVLSLLFGCDGKGTFVQVVLIDVISEKQHAVRAVLVEIDSLSPVTEACGGWRIYDGEWLLFSRRRIEYEYSL